MRKITILIFGTRGDVQPLVALAIGLQNAGYEISIATTPSFEGLVRQFGIGFLPVTPIPDAFSALKVDKRERMIHRIYKRLKWMPKMTPLILQVGADFLNACQDADAIIYSQTCLLFGPGIGEKLKIPTIPAFTSAMIPTRAYPLTRFGFSRKMGGSLNRLSWFIAESSLMPLVRWRINQVRKEVLNLPPLPFHVKYSKRFVNEQKMILVAISPNFLPRPQDWADKIKMTGYWYLNTPSDFEPPKELDIFLNSGTPPIYIGYGSMITGNPQETLDLILETLSITKQRGIVETGGEMILIESPYNLLKIGSVPHDWLFPKMAAVVHHGGGGATAAGLRAGVPSIVVPFVLDMPFNGRRLADLGVGPEPIPYKKLSVESLAAAISRAVNDELMREKAARLGSLIRNEDGVHKAVDAVNQIFQIEAVPRFLLKYPTTKN